MKRFNNLLELSFNRRKEKSDGKLNTWPWLHLENPREACTIVDKSQFETKINLIIVDEIWMTNCC